MGLIKDITEILEYGSKTTTYKFALMRGILDYVVEHPGEHPINSFHFIPVIYIAKQFIHYYFPLWHSEVNQGPLQSSKRLKLYSFFEKFTSDEKISKITEHYQQSSSKSWTGDICKDLTMENYQSTAWIEAIINLPDTLPKPFVQLLHKTRRVIIDQPIQFIPNVNKMDVHFFSLLNRETPVNSTYQEHRMAASSLAQPKQPLSWLDWLDSYEDTFITIDNYSYERLAEQRFFIREVIAKKWLEFVLRKVYAIDRNFNENVVIENILKDLLNLSDAPDIQRNSQIMTQYRAIYDEIGPLKSPFTGNMIKNLKDAHIDHFIPWRYFQVNRFWNLFPCEPSINLKKSALLPIISDEIRANLTYNLEKIVLNYREKPIILNDIKYFYQILMKQKPETYLEYSNDQIVKDLIAYLEFELHKLYEIIPGVFEWENVGKFKINGLF